MQQSTSWQLTGFEKYDRNPILVPHGISWESKDVFNPTAWTDGETVYLLYRAEDSTGVGEWNGTSRIGIATSSDGFTFEREGAPVLEPSKAYEMPGGCEDPRVVKIEQRNRFYMTYTAYDGATARLAMASSTDLREWRKHGPIFPDMDWTKAGSILPEPIDGEYWMYFGDTNIWAAHSDDLRQWEVVEEPVMRPRPGHFDEKLIEPGPSPILTSDGILLVYNASDCNGVYSAGQVLFDASDPTRVLGRSDTAFFEPSEVLEKTSGQVPNVVFVEGMVRFKERWFLYFGMGDSAIGVATTTTVS